MPLTISCIPHIKHPKHKIRNGQKLVLIKVMYINVKGSVMIPMITSKQPTKRYIVLFFKSSEKLIRSH